MTRCPEECRKQWRLVQGKSGWEKQKEEEVEKRREEKEKDNEGEESSRRMGNMG